MYQEVWIIFPLKDKGPKRNSALDQHKLPNQELVV